MELWTNDFWFVAGYIYIVGGALSMMLAYHFDSVVGGAEAVPWFIFWPIFDLIAVGILTVRVLRRMFKGAA